VQELHCRRQHNCIGDNIIDGYRARGNGGECRNRALDFGVGETLTKRANERTRESEREKEIRGSTYTCRSERESRTPVYLYEYIENLVP